MKVSLHYLAVTLVASACTPTSAFLLPSTGYSRPTSTKISATWSNGQAIKEYQDFLATGKSEIDVSKDGASVIVAPRSGDSNLALALKKLGMGDDLVLHPGEPLPPSLDDRSSFPIYVALPPDQLEAAIIENLSDKISGTDKPWDAKRADLVFFSCDRGNVEAILKRHNLCRDSTAQVLVSFTTPGKDLMPMDMAVKFGVDSRGEDKWCGETSSCGIWKDAVASRLGKGNLRCRTGFYREWRRHMWERTAFDACFHLIGSCTKEPVSLKDVAEFYGDEVSEMAWQISSLLRGSMAMTLTYGFEERMMEFAINSVCANDICTIKMEAFPFTNGPVLDISRSGLARGFGDPAPLHTEYLEYAKEKGLLEGVMVPKVEREQRAAIMREGNLRADGVI